MRRGDRGPGLTVYGCDPAEDALFRLRAAQLGVHVVTTDQPLCESNAALARWTPWISVDHKHAVTAPTLRALRAVGVRVLTTRSVGSNHVDVAQARALGISVRTVAYSPDSVADHTLMSILMLVRDAGRVVRRADRHDYRLPGTRGKELRDLTVGVVGTGRIGTAVVARLRGFGCRILAHDPHRGAEVEYADLDDVLAASDVVTLHVPLHRGTHHLLGRDRIRRLRPGAFVVNTSRGGLVDTRALLRALECGHLGGAALDVVEGEEGLFYADCRGGLVDPVLARLHTLPNVVVTPHTAYYTEHALRDVVENTLLGCLDQEDGEQHG